MFSIMQDLLGINAYTAVLGLACVVVLSANAVPGEGWLSGFLNRLMAATGTGRLIFVSGTPGAGKTTCGEGLKRENGFAPLRR